ncbi:hypothetical protein FHL15_003885 [Xylaria flabelliformis]|uniref:Zn(2)-C6 fungal-type domain-containing protein n=1 Tax=Xylaria flabelliformis TaxID=2512241 RepID=A0A553I4V1_9PEZI|nr:hypothetical protein FHL15_003885 [Xylaria flabelliformis]
MTLHPDLDSQSAHNLPPSASSMTSLRAPEPIKGKMIYCTYCGKSFTRKEHLERHLPSHTNVKPHRCPHCSLGFSRRDLLSRHLSTYHIEKDEMQRTPGSVHTLNGKTQIACRSCAQAKTGCDKLLPKCTRCVEKGLPCELRYARRSSKAAARAEASAAHHKQLEVSMLAPLPEAKLDSMTAIPEIRSIGIQAPQLGDRFRVPTPPEETPMTIDPRVSQHDNLHMKSSSADSFPGSEGLYTTTLMGGIDGLQYDTGFITQDMSVFEWRDGMYGDMTVNMQTPQDNVRNPTYILSPPSANSEELVSPTISTHTRRNSTMSPNLLETAVGEMESDISPESQSPALQAMIAAEPGWPLARCNHLVYSGDCQRTAFLHLNHLKRNLNHEGAYSSLTGLSMAEWNSNGLPLVTPIRSETRDKIIAIAQSFLHRALDTHSNGHSYNDEQQNGDPRLLPFLVLPSSENLDYFLQSYMRSLHFYYSLVSSNRLDPNDMIQKNQTATLLVLFMIAQGASSVPIEEARALSTGLIETCRISLFDIIEKNVTMCADSTVHRCALIFTLLAAWSGDKWLMDIAMGQRGMYLAMLQHAGMFRKPESPMAFLPNNPTISEESWRSWVDRETMNRLVYNWVMVDQELSLFHDKAPVLLLNELHAPLPGPEEWWTSLNGDYWMIAMSANPDLSSLTPSLYNLFQDFLHDRLSADQAAGLTPYRMRLLLHPIHSHLYHSRITKLDFSGTSVNKTATPNLPSEDQILLERWRGICYSYYTENPSCPVTQTNLVLSHLISLNDLTHFPTIEQYARCESINSEQLIFPSSDAIYHCGQVLRIVRTMPTNQRPAWWSVAVYRVMLILWIFSICQSNASLDQNASSDENSATESSIVIDQFELMDKHLFNFLWKGNSVAVLSGQHGSTMSLAEPAHVLLHAVRIINEGICTRFSDGIKRKLLELHTTWYSTPLIN